MVSAKLIGKDETYLSQAPYYRTWVPERDGIGIKKQYSRYYKQEKDISDVMGLVCCQRLMEGCQESEEKSQRRLRLIRTRLRRLFLTKHVRECDRFESDRAFA